MRLFEQIVIDKGTDREFALIEYKNGGRIFLSMKMCKKKQIRDLVELIKSNYKSKDPLCDIVCLCYGEICYNKKYGYEIKPKNEESIKWDLVILGPEGKAYL